MANDTPLFVMQQPATFKWPVRVPVPVDGKYVHAEFTGVFPNASEDEIKAILKNDPATGRPTRTDRDVAQDVLQGFEDVKTPGGADLAFTPENKAALLANPRVATAVTNTFLMAARGLAAEKNS